MRFALFAGFLLGLAIGSIAMFVADVHDEVAYADHIGRKGAACFANHTCRENLKCMVADGIDPTCVKP